MRTELLHAFGDMVEEIGMRKGGFDWYTTLTYRDRTEEECRSGWTRVGGVYARRTADQFLRELGEEVGLHDIHWVRAMEMQRDRSVPHWHMLIGGCGDVRRTDLWRYWFERHGFARILPYDRHLGVRFYLCKYVVKELGDVEFSRNLELT